MWSASTSQLVTGNTDIRRDVKLLNRDLTVEEEGLLAFADHADAIDAAMVSGEEADKLIDNFIDNELPTLIKKFGASLGHNAHWSVLAVAKQNQVPIYLVMVQNEHGKLVTPMPTTRRPYIQLGNDHFVGFTCRAVPFSITEGEGQVRVVSVSPSLIFSPLFFQAESKLMEMDPQGSYLGNYIADCIKFTGADVGRIKALSVSQESSSGTKLILVQLNDDTNMICQLKLNPGEPGAAPMPYPLFPLDYFRRETFGPSQQLTSSVQSRLFAKGFDEVEVHALPPALVEEIQDLLSKEMELAWQPSWNIVLDHAFSSKHEPLDKLLISIRDENFDCLVPIGGKMEPDPRYSGYLIDLRGRHSRIRTISNCDWSPFLVRYLAYDFARRRESTFPEYRMGLATKIYSGRMVKRELEAFAHLDPKSFFYRQAALIISNDIVGSDAIANDITFTSVLSSPLFQGENHLACDLLVTHQTGRTLLRFGYSLETGKINPGRNLTLVDHFAK